MTRSSTKRSFYVVYILAFLASFHFALPIYIESSFIEGIVSKTSLGFTFGLIYSIASLLTFIIFLNISKLLRIFGNYRLSFLFIALDIIALLALSVADSLTPLLVIAVFILHIFVGNIIGFNIDLFLESFSNNESTGTIRGTYMTVMNITFVVAPFIAGLILTNGDFWKIFLASGFIMIPGLLLLFIGLRDHKDPVYDNVRIIDSLKEIWRRKNIYRIMVVGFLLQFFYSWMIIYTPIYLHEIIGIPFSEIVGVIMPIALLPFILFQFMLGKIADSTLGEKEILTAGFVIIGLSTIALSFVTSTSIIVWALLLFMTRVGASFIEIMADTYFYKKIDATDTPLMGFYKNVRPLAFLVGPILASTFLYFLPFHYLFIALGIVMLTGLRYSLTIQDTK